MTEGHEIVAHPADVGFRAWGPDWAAALGQAVAALADIETSGRALVGTERRAVSLQGDDREVLLVQLLEECLFRVDAEDWLATGASLVVDADGVRGDLHGGAIDADTRADGVHVKAITWHQLEAEERGDGVWLQVFVDL